MGSRWSTTARMEPQNDSQEPLLQANDARWYQFQSGMLARLRGKWMDLNGYLFNASSGEWTDGEGPRPAGALLFCTVAHINCYCEYILFVYQMSGDGDAADLLFSFLVGT
jgi:hypothetical protein